MRFHAWIALTAQGKALLARCRERVLADEARLAAGLSAQEEQVIRRWLAALAEGAGGTEA